MDQINEAYEFIKEVFTSHADDILRKVYVLPESAATIDPTSVSVEKPKAKKSTGWIQHPCPRNIMKLK